MTLDILPRDALREIKDTLHLSLDDLARALCVNPRTLERWQGGESIPQRESRALLNPLTQLSRRLSESFADPDGARLWLRDANRYLGWLSPLEALRAGRLDRVEAALTALDAGIFI
jgi:transcriptional regulator with XRE-family HTH domain